MTDLTQTARELLAAAYRSHGHFDYADILLSSPLVGEDYIAAFAIESALARAVPELWVSPFGSCACNGANECPGCNPNKAIELARVVATMDERYRHPPCSECGAMTATEAESMCACSGDKDDCHGCSLWPEASTPTPAPPEMGEGRRHGFPPEEYTDWEKRVWQRGYRAGMDGQAPQPQAAAGGVDDFLNRLDALASSWIAEDEYSGVAVQCADELRAAVEVFQQDATPTQPGEREGMSYWAVQYPGKMPTLYGARAIAKLNWYPDEGAELVRLQEVEKAKTAPGAEVKSNG